MTEMVSVSPFKLLMLFPRFQNDLLAFMQELNKNHGDCIEFGMGNLKGVFLNRPEYYQRVLIDNWTNYPKSDRYQVFSPLIGDSILSSNGDRWKYRRTLIQPLFTASKIKIFDHTIQNTVKEILDEWKDGEINISEQMSLITFKLICRIAFSGDLEEVFSEFFNLVHQLAIGSKDRAITPFLFLNDMPLPRNFRYKNLSARAHEIVDQIIADRKVNKRDYEDILALLMREKAEDGSSLNDEELRHEMITLLIAGNETSGLSLSWGLYELAKEEHHQLQEKLFQEIKGVLGEREIVELADLDNMPLLTNFVDEVLRMHPAVWLFTRQAKEDDEFNGIKVKKGSVILLCPFLMHRNENYWPEPNKLNPDRFNQDFPRYGYAPFAHGPRACVGKLLGLMEIKMAMASLLRNFSFDSDQGVVNHKAILNLYPEKNIVLKAKRRD